MSWSDRSSFQGLKLATLYLALGLALGGCLRPLYGPAANGASIQSVLAAIDVAMIPDQLGHALRSELIFLLDGSGEPAPKKYIVTVKPTLSKSSAVVDSVSFRADATTIIGRAEFTMTPIGGGPAVVSGVANGTATYDRTAQRFGNVRAERDAELRLGKMLAEQIRNRLAATLSAR